MVQLFNSGILQYLTEESCGQVKKGLYDEYMNGDVNRCKGHNEVLIELIPLSKDSISDDYLDYCLQPLSIEYTSRDTLIVGEYYMNRDSISIAETNSLKECGEILKKLAVNYFDSNYKILEFIF